MSHSKRDELVQKALGTFYKGGFNAIGMDKIAAETGVSKTSIYKHFRTKDDLILATLRLRDEQFRNWLVRRIEALGTTPRERLSAIFIALGEWFLEPGYQGCMFVKASSEFQDRSHPIHAISAEHKRMLHAYFTGLVEAANIASPAALASQLLLLKEGAIVMAHLHDPSEITKISCAAAEVLIDTAIAAH